MSKASREYKAWSKKLAKKMNSNGDNCENKPTLKEYRKIRRFLNQDKKLTNRRNRDFESLWEHSLQYPKKIFCRNGKILTIKRTSARSGIIYRFEKMEAL